MRLDVNLDALWATARQMGAEPVDIDLGGGWDNTEIQFDRELSNSGIEVKLEELESEEGLLSVRGRQVILFIPDHSFRVLDVLDDPSSGRKFHIADCKTLDQMRERNRFERYKITNNLSGIFEIFGTSDDRSEIVGNAKLNVCKNCINMLNYKGAANCPAKGRNDIVNSFDIEELFMTYSSVFKTLPREFAINAQRGYSNDWKQVSENMRREAGYICNACEVDLNGERNLLHVHHVNGEKSDNNPSNLMVLCADCHRKEPYHGHMFVKHSHVQIINRLRNDQGKIRDRDWASVYRFADPAVRGVIDHCKRKSLSPPEIGYKVTDKNGRLVEIELGWPDKQEGVYLGKYLEAPGWKLLSLRQAVEYYS